MTKTISELITGVIHTWNPGSEHYWGMLFFAVLWVLTTFFLITYIQALKEAKRLARTVRIKHTLISTRK